MENIGFPIYLFVACIANGSFLFKSVLDVRKAEPGSIFQAGSQLMLGAAISELIWVVPCFVQCAVYIFVENDNETGKVACDIQGFYSLVSSVSSMLLAPLLSWFTLAFLIQDSSKNVSHMKWFCAICIFAAILLGVVPLLPGVRDHAGYADMGEGFCYWDLAADSVAAFFLVLTALLFSATFAINGRALYYLYLGQDSSQLHEKCGTLLALMISYAITWILWPVGAIITLSNNSFPQGLMIAGGMLGHAQALVNPILYGVCWRRFFLNAYTLDPVKTNDPTVQDKGDMPQGA